MSEFEESVPTSPDLETDSGIVTSAGDFSGKLTLDLTDEEIKRAFEIIVPIKKRWENIFRVKFSDPNLSFTMDQALDMVEQFEDEIKTRLAEDINILATVDTTPLLEGKPLVIEWIGRMPGDNVFKHGLDHERKEFEVKRATNRGEDYYGQKGPIDGSYKRRAEGDKRRESN